MTPRPDRQATKHWMLGTGLLVLAAAWTGPMLWNWRDSVFAHMTAHMAVVAVAAPLIAIGLAGSWNRTRAAPAAAGFVTSLPVIASLVELVTVWGWHMPAARAFAEASLAGTVLEQVSFLAAGVFLWNACLNGRDETGGDGAGAFGLLLTSVHMTLLGALLALSDRPLYGDGQVTCFGLTLDAAQDQQLGGIVMLLVGAAVYLAGGLYLLARVLDPAPVDRKPTGTMVR